MKEFYYIFVLILPCITTGQDTAPTSDTVGIIRKSLEINLNDSLKKKMTVNYYAKIEQKKETYGNKVSIQNPVDTREINYHLKSLVQRDVTKNLLINIRNALFWSIGSGIVGFLLAIAKVLNNENQLQPAVFIAIFWPVMITNFVKQKKSQ